MARTNPSCKLHLLSRRRRFCVPPIVLSGEKPDHPTSATRKRARTASTRGQQRSGARTQPARARTKPARFASPSTEPSSAGSDTDSGRPPQLGNSDKATGGAVTQLPPLSADDWTTLQALIAQARGPSPGSGHRDGGGAPAAPAPAAPAPAAPAPAAPALSPFPSERRPRYRARGDTSRRRASSSSPSSYGESPRVSASSTPPSPWLGHLRAPQASSIPLLGVQVPQALWEKIWAKKYVDLRELLTHEREAGPYETRPAPSTDPQASGKKQPPLTPDQWAHSFDIYATIYIEKHPAVAQALLTYTRYVKTMKVTLKNDWMWYDKAFRWDKERSDCSWLDYRLDLEFRSVQRVAHVAVQTGRQEAGRPAALTLSSARAAGLPPGYCFAYHSRGPGCSFTSCSFLHYCPRCRRRHPAYTTWPPAHTRDRPTHDQRPRRQPQDKAKKKA
ncbi:uncharacterized protein [Procambarus clarkii]|uniref:uncharacterized protein n=1 Tax=Procambarus clarkii TaxID=6728 RepID=UPI003744441E